MLSRKAKKKYIEIKSNSVILKNSIKFSISCIYAALCNIKCPTTVFSSPLPKIPALFSFLNLSPIFLSFFTFLSWRPTCELDPLAVAKQHITMSRCCKLQNGRSWLGFYASPKWNKWLTHSREPGVHARQGPELEETPALLKIVKKFDWRHFKKKR